MRYLSVCSGIEAATVAWHPLGWTPAGFAEIDRFPGAVLAHHYPQVRNYGDFTTIEETDVGAIDLLVGGTPCQSFSIAGLRGGLGDDRGNLALEFCRLALRARPRWLVWENVPGVLSSNGGRDFGSILGALAECGYGFAYRVLDAQYFGLAQRRKRVFVVGYLGDWRPAAAVLSERESLSGHPAPRRGEGKGVAALTSTGVGTCGADDNQAQAGHLIASALSPPLTSNPYGDHESREDLLVAHALMAKDGRGVHSDMLNFVSHAVALPILEAGARTGASTTDKRAGMGVGDDGDPMFTLQSGKQHAVAFMENQRGELRTDDVAAALSIGGGKPGQGYPAVAFGWQNSSSRSFSVSEHITPTLDKSKTPAVAFDLRGREGGAQFEGPHDTANIRAASGGSSRSYVADMAVRRLTPKECCRLQGFPDDYLDITYRGKPAADGPKYKALGNSMAVPVMRWIGERIAHVSQVAG
jgi:DNA (cytosine-5)-methyltransferase 1